MSEQPDGPYRPLMLGQVAEPRVIPARQARGATPRVLFTNNGARVARVDEGFQDAMDVLNDQVKLSVSINAADLQLVLVLEGIDGNVDLAPVAIKLGWDVLLESRSEVEPTDEFALISDKAKNPLVSSCLHAVCMNQTSFNKLRSLRAITALGGDPVREAVVRLSPFAPKGHQSGPLPGWQSN